MKDLQHLKEAAVKAKAEYYDFKPNGSIDDDLAERTLLHKFSQADTAYKNALDMFLKDKPKLRLVTNPATREQMGNPL